MSFHDQFNDGGRSTGGGDGERRGPVPGRYDRIQIPMDLWVYLRLIAGAFPVTTWKEAGKPVVVTKPMLESKRHVLRPKKTADKWEFLTCPRGLNDFEDPAKCPLCNFLDDREAEPDWFAAHVALGLANYHIVEKAPAPGSGQKKSYKNYVPCEVTETNPNCKLCAAKYPFQLGYLGHFSTSWSDYQELKRLNKEMGTHCQCGGDIIAIQAACATCHTTLASIESGGMSDSEFSRFLANRQVCPTCRAQVDVVPIRSCTTCSEPRPLSIYDANIRLMRTKKGESKVLKGEIVSWGPLDAAYGKIEPLDLVAIYSPEPIGRLTRRVPGYRNLPHAGAADPNAVPRNPMEAAAAAAMASGTVAALALPPGIFGPLKAQAPAPMPAMPGSTAGKKAVAPGQAALPFPVTRAPAQRPAPPPALEIPPELPPDEGDLGVNDGGDEQ
jgi:hypothetical protein